MRYVLWAAVIAALFVALVTAVLFVPLDKPEATPEIVYVEVTPTPGVVIIPGGEFDGDLDNLWVAIPVEGMPEGEFDD